MFGVGIDANIVHASIKAVLSGVMRSQRASGHTGSVFGEVVRLAA